MHSHHSHSGDYTAHGVDPMNDIITQAENMKFHTYCLTEHMPRINSRFLYPEEVENEKSEDDAMVTLQLKFNLFLKRAQEIKESHTNVPPKIIIGTEIESCDSEHIQYAKKIMEKNKNVIKFCVGSIHHINGIPIDFDQENWTIALESFDNNLRDMLLSYFELQYEMLINVKPLVVGHFDLYKLFLPKDLKVNKKTGKCTNDENSININDISYLELWDEIKKLVIRNLKFIDSYGGVIEINTSGLRKGLKEPYPSKIIGDLVKEFCNGRFVLSDDAHAVSHVGVCYGQTLLYIKDVLQLDQMYYLQESTQGEIQVKTISMAEFSSNEFWKTKYIK